MMAVALSGRLSAIQEALQQEGLDGWLFFDHHLRDPLAYRVLGLPNHSPTRRWYYLIPASGEPRALVHRIESGVLDALPGEKTIYSSWESQTTGLAGLLNGSRRIAMQYSPQCSIPYVAMVDAGTIELVRNTGVQVVSSANLIQLFEARWNSRQHQQHLEAGRRVDRIRGAAFDKIGESLRSNHPISEWDVNRFIRDTFTASGLVTDHGPIVAVNSNMSDPHYEPTADRHRPINKGDAVLIDMWAKLDQEGAVYYDITWTGFCGSEIPARIQNIFEIVSGARDAAVARVKDAIGAKRELRGFEVDDAARAHIRDRGYGENFVHRTGHSIGEEVHGTGANMDNLETHDDRRVIAGTCFSIEPGVYLDDFGIRAEVNVFVGEQEAGTTGEVQRELVRIPT
ncbi:MAG: M24 family metallopeptidase [Bryobacteraceae bacterium]